MFVEEGCRIIISYYKWVQAISTVASHAWIA